MQEKITFEIAVPKNSSYGEMLRFWCQTADAEDPSLPFMASMWSYAIANGELSGKQAKSADNYILHRLKEYGLLNIVNND